MTGVLVCLQVGFEHLTDAHGVLSLGRHVDWRLHGASQLQFVCLDWHDANKRHLSDELLWILVVKAVLVHAPLGTFKEQTLHVGSILQTLLDVRWIALICHDGVSRHLVKSPCLSTASCLHESGKVRLWNVQTTEPDDPGLLDLDPVLVLLVPPLEVVDPIDEVLLVLRGLLSPHWWHPSVEHAACKVIQRAGHTNLTSKCSLQVEQ